jgi:hypothetical protein
VLGIGKTHVLFNKVAEVDRGLRQKDFASLEQWAYCLRTGELRAFGFDGDDGQ